MSRMYSRIAGYMRNVSTEKNTENAVCFCGHSVFCADNQGSMSDPIDLLNTRQYATPAPDMAAVIDGEDVSQPEDPASYGNGFREASRRGLHLLNQFAWFVCNAKNPRLSAYQVASALGLGPATGKSDTDLARLCGVTSRACISKGRLEFQRANNISPMLGQKKESTRNTYRQSRRNKVNGR